MDATLKAKWVEELRSGKYQQGHGLLRDGDKYCCLGVLCEVAGLEIDADGARVAKDVDSDVGGYATLRELVGNKEVNGCWQRNDGTHEFHRHTFPEIADWIEENVPAT